MEMTYDGALVMPSNFAVVEEEEMTYLDGGVFVSKNKCIEGLAYAGLNPYTVIAIALTYALAKKLINAVKKVGGLATWAVSTILSFAASQVIAAAVGLAKGAIHHGVDITWQWNPLGKGSWGVNTNVH